MKVNHGVRQCTGQRSGHGRCWRSLVPADPRTGFEPLMTCFGSTTCLIESTLRAKPMAPIVPQGKNERSRPAGHPSKVTAVRPSQGRSPDRVVHILRGGAPATINLPISSEGGSRTLNHLLDLDPDTGLLPPGRYAASLADLYAQLVSSTGSATREAIWKEWAQHRVIMEAVAGDITRLWVGGSFVSRKPDPSDVDVTYLLRAEAYDRLDRDTLSYLDDLTLRAWCVENGMRVDAHLVRLPEEMAVSQMMPSLLTREASESFRDIGLYDEVWQCTRGASGTNGVPGELRRGYVEVLL